MSGAIGTDGWLHFDVRWNYTHSTYKSVPHLPVLRADKQGFFFRRFL